MLRVRSLNGRRESPCTAGPPVARQPHPLSGAIRRHVVLSRLQDARTCGLPFRCWVGNAQLCIFVFCTFPKAPRASHSQAPPSVSQCSRFKYSATVIMRSWTFYTFLETSRSIFSCCSSCSFCVMDERAVLVQSCRTGRLFAQKPTPGESDRPQNRRGRASLQPLAQLRPTAVLPLMSLRIPLVLLGPEAFLPHCTRQRCPVQYGGTSSQSQLHFAQLPKNTHMATAAPSRFGDPAMITFMIADAKAIRKDTFFSSLVMISDIRSSDLSVLR